jgi:FkbM family methyltransferase
MIDKIKALMGLIVKSASSRVPSPLWLFYTSSRLDRKFYADHQKELASATVDDSYQYITIDNQTFVWPRGAPLKPFVQILSELLQKNHPHHYLVAPTLIDASDTVLDIGACEGAFSALAAGKGARVIAVEPSLKMARVIHRLFEIRKLVPPQIRQCLLGGGEKRDWYFRDDPTNPGGSRIIAQPEGDSYPVPMTTLDECIEALPEGVTYIKCDAEGMDASILKSGKKALAKYKPKIAVTTYHRSGDYREIEDFLTPLGYRCHGKGLLYSTGEFRTLMLHAAPETAR